jgi:hypothetical protein
MPNTNTDNKESRKDAFDRINNPRMIKVAVTFAQIRKSGKLIKFTQEDKDAFREWMEAELVKMDAMFDGNSEDVESDGPFGSTRS